MVLTIIQLKENQIKSNIELLCPAQSFLNILSLFFTFYRNINIPNIVFL